MATLAIDAGTTLIKAVVSSDVGLEIAISSREATVSSPHPSWSEQDMHQVWESVEAACMEVLWQSTESIAAIAVTAQGDGAWIIDSEGAPLRPAILWNDGRAAAEIAAFVEAGKDREAWSTNGSLTSLGLPNAIMMWLAANEPDTLNSAHAVLTCGGWIIHQLTGIVAQDLSEACAPWIDIATGKISSELLGLYGLSEYGHLIPPVLETPCLVLSDTIAAHWGLPATTPRESLDATGTAPQSLALSGGGAHSRLWCQIIADVTGIPATRTQDSQVGAKGAHVYASVATGAFSSLTDAVAALVQPGETFTPRPEDHKLHSRRFELFCDLRGAASPLWHRAKVGAADE